MSKSLWTGLIICALCTLAACKDEVSYQGQANAQADAQDDTEEADVPLPSVQDVRETEPAEPIDIGSGSEGVPPEPDFDEPDEDVPPEPDFGDPDPDCDFFLGGEEVLSRTSLGRSDFDRILDVDIQGDRAYVTHSVGVTVLDISNPANPDILGVFEAVQPGAQALALVQTPEGLEGVLAVLGDGVRKLEFPPNTSAIETGSYDLSGSAGAEYARDVEVIDEVAYVASYSQGFWTFDVSSGRPQPLGNCCQNRDGNLLDGPVAVAVRGNYAYIVDNTSGLIVVDVEDPSSPTAIGALEVEGEFQAVALEGDILVMGSAQGVLLRVDVSTPSNPTILNELSLPELENIPVSVLGLDIAGDVVFVAAGEQSLYQVSFQSEPPFVAPIPLRGTDEGVGAVTVVDNHYYVADGDILMIIERACR